MLFIHFIPVIPYGDTHQITPKQLFVYSIYNHSTHTWLGIFKKQTTMYALNFLWQSNKKGLTCYGKTFFSEKRRLPILPAVNCKYFRRKRA